MAQSAVSKANSDQHVRAARDARLVEAYRGGRRDAFDDLVRSYDLPVRRVLAQLGAAPGDVEDLAQDVFLRIFRNLRHFRGQSSFYTWLYRITVNVFFDHSKKRKRADVRQARLQSAFGDASEVHRATRDPYDACYERLTNEHFARAIDALPEAFRAVVAMREVDDLSYEEIASVAGISVGTVRSRLSRARARLKALLRPMLLDAAA